MVFRAHFYGFWLLVGCQGLSSGGALDAGGARATGGADVGGTPTSAGTLASGGSSGDAGGPHADAGALGIAGTGGVVVDVGHPFAPEPGKTALLIGQSGRRAHLDYVLGTHSVPAGGSVYAELYTGKFLSFEQSAFVDYLERYFPGSLVEVGLSWKDNRVNAGYCDVAEPACLARGGATDPERDIVAGKFDAPLLTFGATLRSHPSLRFLVRVDYEVSPNLHCSPADIDDCPAYVNAFRYIKALLAKARVPNVELVFHPTRGWAKQLYPGAEATDWIAFSVFNHDLCLPVPEGANAGCSQQAELDPNLATDLAWAVAQGKPILLAEASVQNPNASSAAGFNEYLRRLFGLAQKYSVRGVTYINMKWGGQWIYGEDWTTGAFGNVDARLDHFGETRQYFCGALQGASYVGLGGALTCDSAAQPPLVVPPDLDAQVYERLVLLSSNLCLSAGTGANGGSALGQPVIQTDCAAATSSGQARIRSLERNGYVTLWSDVTWSCFSAEADVVVSRDCQDVAAQQFQLKTPESDGAQSDVQIVAPDGRCLGTPAMADGAALDLAPCDAPGRTWRR